MATVSSMRSVLGVTARAYCEDCAWQHFCTDRDSSRNAARKHARARRHRVIVLDQRTAVYEGRQ